MYVLALILDASSSIEGKKTLCDPLQKILLEKFWTCILISLDVA